MFAFVDYIRISTSRGIFHHPNGLLHEPDTLSIFTNTEHFLGAMPNPPPPSDFKIHVDGSCLTDSTDLEMPREPKASEEPAVQHDSPSENDNKEGEEHKEDTHKKGKKKHGTREQRMDRIEAEIKAAARTVVENIENDATFRRPTDSELSMQTDESDEPERSEGSHEGGTEYTYGDGTEMTYDGTDPAYESDAHSEHEEGADNSSHHDGDVDDDVFSRDSRNSHRSSLNSSNGHHPSDEAHQEKVLTSPVVGEEANTESISPLPSRHSSIMHRETPNTPSRVLSRPPFRTPSSVRAIQMSSPTPSLYASPRSTKRNHPTVSRLGTPTSRSSPKNKTPTRFKKEYPLVLLHVTVLPLQWSYANAILSPELPASLYSVKESYRLLQEKLGETVLTRGILLPHPQDSYEVLEERFLEALDLPVRPRAKILRCGHYMGPSFVSSDEESEDDHDSGIVQGERDKAWCDICGRAVRYEMATAGEGEKRFRIKIFASNGLMRAGAWAAAWKEMERVDVEIEPYVDDHLVQDLDSLSARQKHSAIHHEELHEDSFVDDEPNDDHNEAHTDEEANRALDEEARRIHETENRRAHEEEVRRMQDEEQRRMQDEEERRMQDEEVRRVQDEEASRALDEEARRMHEEEMARTLIEEEELRQHMIEEDRMREIYGHESQEPTHNQSPEPRRASYSRPQSPAHGDSLPELLLAAFKVAMQDTKNVVICVLSLFVLILALKPRAVVEVESSRLHNAPYVPEIIPQSRPGEVGSNKAEAPASPVHVVVETTPKIPVSEQVQPAAHPVVCAPPEIKQEALPKIMPEPVVVQQTLPKIVPEPVVIQETLPKIVPQPVVVEETLPKIMPEPVVVTICPPTTESPPQIKSETSPAPKEVLDELPLKVQAVPLETEALGYDETPQSPVHVPIHPPNLPDTILNTPINQ